MLMKALPQNTFSRLSKGLRRGILKISCFECSNFDGSTACYLYLSRHPQRVQNWVDLVFSKKRYYQERPKSEQNGNLPQSADKSSPVQHASSSLACACCHTTLYPQPLLLCLLILCPYLQPVCGAPSAATLGAPACGAPLAVLLAAPLAALLAAPLSAPLAAPACGAPLAALLAAPACGAPLAATLGCTYLWSAECDLRPWPTGYGQLRVTPGPCQLRVRGWPLPYKHAVHSSCFAGVM
eukprot:scaffold212488_cov21-Tisochrysis_lutea.AAC.2